MKSMFTVTVVAFLFCQVGMSEETPARFSFVDVEDHFNQKLNEDFHSVAGNNLANVPRGRQTFCGIPFQIGDGCLHLRSIEEELKDFPEEFGPLNVGHKCKSLHFLHSAGWGWPSQAKTGSRVGEYVIQYEDGSESSFPIVCGVNVHDWIGTGATPQAAVAWRGKTPKGVSTELLATSWKNPHPEKTVKSIVMRTTGKYRTAPFCLAITVDRESEGLDYEQLAMDQDMQLVEGVWERRRGEDESVAWITQVVTYHKGKSELAALDADGDVMWKNECDYVTKRRHDIRVLELTDIHVVEGNNKGATWPGPFTVVYTIRNDRLVTIEEVTITDVSRPRVNFWSRKASSD